MKLFCKHLTSDSANQARQYKSAQMISMDVMGFDVKAVYTEGVSFMQHNIAASSDLRI